VVEVLAFEHDLCPADVLRQPRRLRDRRRPAGVVGEQAIEPSGELWVRSGLGVSGGELIEGRDECLRHEPATVGAEVTPDIRDIGLGGTRR
jgi:hypothetical protein